MSTSVPPFLAVALVCSIALPAAARPQGDPLCIEQQEKLLPDIGDVYGNFGGSVSLSGDTALLGATGYQSGGVTVGAAYVFVRAGSSWSQEARLAPAATQETVGQSVAIHGDTAVVGAPNADGLATRSGAAYVFVRNGTSWTQQARLVASDGTNLDRFGDSVAIHGETVVVGAPRDSDLGLYHGSAYVFVRSGGTWSQQAKLVAGDIASSGQLGYSASISGDTAILGAVGSQAAYVFVRSANVWSQQAKLTAPGSSFGVSVSISDDTAAVGTHSDVTEGSAYVFVRSGTTWMQEALILASDGATKDWFGWAVSVSGDSLVVAAPRDDAPTNSGSAYLFTRTGGAWSERGKLRASDGSVSDELGRGGVSVEGDTAIVGVPLNVAGSAYVYAWPPALGSVYCTCPAGPCGNPDPAAGCANSTGEGALLAAQGTTSPDEVNLLASGLRPNQFGIFFEGRLAVMLPFGDGFRCAGGTVLRITNVPVLADGAGGAAYGPCFGDPTISSVTGVVPGSGDTRHYQFWYRDPGSPCGNNFNLSNAVSVTWGP